MRPAQAGCGRKRRGGGRQQTLRAGGVQAGWAVMNERHNATDERFHPCPGGRHWGPRGAAGILPYTVAGDGRAWVLLSHRSPHVQRGGTWSTFGGAIDVGETAWRAAVRETCEEIRGITPDQADIAGGTYGSARRGAGGRTPRSWCASRCIPVGPCRASVWLVVALRGRPPGWRGFLRVRSRPLTATFIRRSRMPGRRSVRRSRRRPQGGPPAGVGLT